MSKSCFRNHGWAAAAAIATVTVVLLPASNAAGQYIRMPALAASHPPPAQDPRWSPGPGWTLTWSSNFDEGASLKDWNLVADGNGKGQETLQYYSPANIALQPGAGLVMTARRDQAGDQCWYGTCEYSSALLDTKWHFEQKYGLFAADIKLPTGRGLWPAFWMAGANTGLAQASLDSTGEIDIVEINNQEPADSITAFAHFIGYQYTAKATLPTPVSAGYHIYAVEWTPTGITFLVDGTKYGSAAAPAGVAPYDQPFYLILNLAVGGNWPGPPDTSTVFPSHMDVAWVRAYKQK